MFLTNNPIKIIWATIRSLFSKIHFSWINFVNFINIVILVLTAQLDAGIIPMGLSLLVISVLSAILKARQSHKMLIKSGVGKGGDYAFYIVTILVAILSAFDMFVNKGHLADFLSEKQAMIVSVSYSVLLMYLRTAYTNQTQSVNQDDASVNQTKE